MTPKRVRRRSQSTPRSEQLEQHSEQRSEPSERSEQRPPYAPTRQRRTSQTSTRERRNLTWTETSDKESSSSNQGWLTSLIEQDAPLKTNTSLVLMYGPFQAEMVPDNGQGVASWLRDCVRKHGIPSLVRFDYRHRAQVFRRDQFQSWLEPLINRATG